MEVAGLSGVGVAVVECSGSGQWQRRWQRRRVAVCGAMWRRVVLWQATLLLADALDFTYYTRTRLYPPAPSVECFDYPEWSPNRYTRESLAGWSHSRPSNFIFDGGSYSTTSFGRSDSFSRRLDLFPSKEDIVKEHAKLVQDINGLRQEPFVLRQESLADKTGDYDDTIYLEEIETIPTTSQPSMTSVLSQKKKPSSSIPVLLVGGASQHNVVKSQPLHARPTIDLVGTAVSPLVKHANPFIGQSSSTRTIRICKPVQPPTATVYTKPKPNLLQRILDGIVS